MVRHRSPAIVLTLAAVLSRPAPAVAQDGYPPPPRYPDYSGVESLVWIGIGVGTVAAVGGTAAFSALDAYYVSERRPLPLGVACGQGIFGAVLMGMSGLLIAHDVEGVLPFAVAGGALILALPAISIAEAAGPRRQQASLRLSPTGVAVSGRF